MVWGAICANGTLCLQVVSHRINSEKYQETVGTSLLPILKKKKFKGYTFQQDNASCHVSMNSRAWFDNKKVKLLDWPPLSPDLNPIENVWGILVRKVYPNLATYSTVEALQEAVFREWNKLTPELMSTLINSMPNRLYDVIEKKGHCTKY